VLTDSDGVAARSGLPAGAVVTSVGGHLVRGAGHLEALLQQASAGPLDVAYEANATPGTAHLQRP